MIATRMLKGGKNLVICTAGTWETTETSICYIERKVETCEVSKDTSNKFAIDDIKVSSKYPSITRQTLDCDIKKQL